MADISNNVILGCCPVCHCVIKRAYKDKVHNVGYCTGCGLEWGNPEQRRYGLPQKVITRVEMRRMLNEAYGQLSPHEPHLEVRTLMRCMQLVAVRMTGYSIPDLTVRQLREWGYDVTAGYITKRVEGEGHEI
jgi:hypothetical protein